MAGRRRGARGTSARVGEVLGRVPVHGRAEWATRPGRGTARRSSSPPQEGSSSVAAGLPSSRRSPLPSAPAHSCARARGRIGTVRSCRPSGPPSCSRSPATQRSRRPARRSPPPDGTWPTSSSASVAAACSTSASPWPCCWATKATRWTASRSSAVASRSRSRRCPSWPSRRRPNRRRGHRERGPHLPRARAQGQPP